MVAVDEDGNLNKPSMGTLHFFASPYSAVETVFCASTCTLNIFIKLVLHQDVFRASFHKI